MKIANLFLILIAVYSFLMVAIFINASFLIQVINDAFIISIGIFITGFILCTVLEEISEKLEIK
jgi:uncharacterized membrane protein (DUF485 family)